MGNFLKSILLLIVSLILVTVLAEFTVRIAFHDITTTSNMRTWFGKRWKDNNVEVNSLGFRDTEIVAERAPGSYRIAIIGDSFTFGLGIPAEDRISNVMEQQLNTKPADFDVLNFGKAGATTTEELGILNEFVLPLQPDFILVQWLPNDFEDLRQRWVPRGSSLIANRKLHQQLIQNSALYFLLNTQWNALNRSFGNGGVDYTEYLLAPVQDPGSDAYQTAVRPMIDLLAALQDSGVKFAIILHPLLREEMGADYALAPLHEAVLAECKSFDAMCIDLLPAFSALGPEFDYVSLWVNRFDAHPGSEANQLVADYLIKQLGPEFRND